MGFGDIVKNFKLAQQIRAEIKQPGFSLKVMAAKASKAVGWTLLGIVGVAVAGYLMNTPAIKMALTEAGLSDAMAGIVAMAALWIGKSIANTLANSKSAASPIDGAPINVQAAVRSGPVLSTEEQMVAFMARYNALRNQNIPFEEARKLALSFVTGLDIEK